MSQNLEGPAIHNGFYTVVSTTGQHRTFRVRTMIKKGEEKDPKAPRFLGLLIGANNTTDYNDFAIINGEKVFTFKKFRTPDGKSQFEVLARMFEDINKKDSQYIVKGFKLEVAKHCLRCNKVLTHKESLISGYGPICEGRL